MHDLAGFREKSTYKLLHHSSTNTLLLVYGLYHQSEVRFKYIFRMLEPNKGKDPFNWPYGQRSTLCFIVWKGMTVNIIYLGQHCVLLQPCMQRHWLWV